MILMVMPGCWFGGVLGEDSESVTNKSEDEDIYNFIYNIRIQLRAWRLLPQAQCSAASSEYRADISYFLVGVGYALGYPLWMIIVGENQNANQHVHCISFHVCTVFCIMMMLLCQ